MESKNYICERCGEAACIVHHKKHINPRNINDPEITLNWNNLEALCQSCHNKEHLGKGGACKSGLQFDEQGELVEKPPPGSRILPGNADREGQITFPLL